MRDRLLKESALPAAAAPPGAAPTPTTPVQDAVSALIALGYKPVEASRAVREVAAEDLGSEEIIRHALRVLAGAAA